MILKTSSCHQNFPNGFICPRNGINHWSIELLTDLRVIWSDLCDNISSLLLFQSSLHNERSLLVGREEIRRKTFAVELLSHNYLQTLSSYLQKLYHSCLQMRILLLVYSSVHELQTHLVRTKINGGRGIEEAIKSSS